MMAESASTPQISADTDSEILQGDMTSELGVIPQDWRICPLLEAVRLPSGQVDPRIEPYRSMVLVAPDHIEESTGRLLIKETAAEQHAISGKYMFKSGDIVYSKIRPYLRKAILADFDGLCSADMYPLTPVSGVSAGFMFAILLGNDFSTFADTVSARSGIPKINRSELKEYRFALPPLPEQEAIAEALADVDALLAALDKLIAKKRAIKQAAMQQLLTGKTRLPGFTGEWETKRLDAISVIISGGTPSTHQPEFWGGDVLWCTPTDITTLKGRKYLSKTSRTITERGLQASSAELVPPGSVIMTSRATIGECAINTVPVATNQGFKNFIPNQETCAEFLYYVLQTKTNDFINLCGGSTFLEIGKSQLSAFEVEIPASQSEQNAIATILSDMDAEITALEKRRDKTQQIKQGMMQQLLTGRIRLVNPSTAEATA